MDEAKPLRSAGINAVYTYDALNAAIFDRWPEKGCAVANGVVNGT